MSTESEAESAAEKQNGENFNDEMKDYAKSTMNELLGMFGYEEEITREAVEELQIRLLPDEQENNSALVKSTETTETESAEPVAVTLNPNEAPVVVQIPGEENSGNPSVVPLPAMKTEVVPMSEVPQATPELCSLPSGANESAKAGTALAPHFLAKPPNIKGVYCVVASLPVVNNSGKTNMVFKFWNCIMCSEYFYQKPEVVFRVEHPHLFGSHPDWLYQAAVCQKCHHTLKASKSGLSADLHPKEATSVSHVEVTDDNKLDGGKLSWKLLVTNSSSTASDSTIKNHNPVSSVEKKAALQSTTAHGSTEFIDTSELLFDCYICSKQVLKNSRHGKLRRSKFPTLFSNLPESVGILKGCLTCCERLARQRDRYVTAGISEEDRDYVAHIKIWTGQDISNKLASSGSKNSSCSTCFMCDKYIPENSQKEVKTLNRVKFPSLFSTVPDQIVKLIICDACNRKLLKVKRRFEEAQTAEEERDYWLYINSWRDQKGLEKHMYSKI